MAVPMRVHQIERNLSRSLNRADGLPSDGQLSQSVAPGSAKKLPASSLRSCQIIKAGKQPLGIVQYYAPPVIFVTGPCCSIISESLTAPWACAFVYQLLDMFRALLRGGRQKRAFRHCWPTKNATIPVKAAAYRVEER
jgi:hypothetical protein